MENSSSNTTPSVSFLEPVGFLHLCKLIFFIPLHKLLYISFTSSSLNSNEKEKHHYQKRRRRPELFPNDLGMKREEIESIVNKISLSLSLNIDCSNEQMKEEIAGVHEISALFEENEPSLEEAKEAFFVFDENRDGFIEAEELRGVLVKMGFVEEGSMEIRECEEMIKAYDRNNDGKIDFLEFVEFLEGSF